MKNRYVFVPSGVMKKLARCEMKFSELIQDGEELNTMLVFEGGYRYTVEDLLEALCRIEQENLPVQKVCNDWYSYISNNEQYFSISEPPHYSGLPVTEQDYLYEVWDELGISLICAPEGCPVADVTNTGDLKKLLERYLMEKDFPLAERTFTLREKEIFIDGFENDERLAGATEEEVKLCRAFTEELCAEGNITALRLKGYSCYGGNRLYPCDWEESERCIKLVFEAEDDPVCANTLGYIYYYGRVNGGKPEYEKAYQYYAIAAAGGVLEAMYKTGDMLRHGYGCIKSPKAAFALYKTVYRDTLDKLTRGDSYNFADAAFRMGIAYLNGVGCEKDAREAYRYLYEARYASRLRLRKSDFFGHKSVDASINNALEEAKALIKPGYFQRKLSVNFNELVNEMLSDCPVLAASVKQTDKGAYLTIKQAPFRTEQEPPEMFLRFPSVGLCALTREITLEIDKAENRAEKDDVLFDDIEYESERRRCTFMRCRETVLEITARDYLISADIQNIEDEPL